MGRSRHPCRSPTPDQFARNSSASPTDAWERVRCVRRHAGSGDGRVGSPLRKASLLSTSSPSAPSRSFADRQHLPWKLAFSVSCSWIQRHLNRGLLFVRSASMSVRKVFQKMLAHVPVSECDSRICCALTLVCISRTCGCRETRSGSTRQEKTPKSLRSPFFFF
jgi:hypothetical protein